ncbi:MAG: chemotaxis protein CheA [Actinobacteria bacterium]|nr:chemotaxis protein CheA [Actinomycetota bacterium]
MNADPEMVEIFLEESREGLEQLNLDLVQLEANAGDQELLDRIFRAVHTMKGTCGFLGFDHLEEITHAAEDVLGAVRRGELRVTADLTTSLLRLADVVEQALNLIAEEGSDEHVDANLVAPLLRTHLSEGPLPQQPEAPVAERDAAAARAEPAHAREASVRVDVKVLDQLQDLVSDIAFARAQLAEEIVGNERMAEPYRRLRQASKQLQDIVMFARMQPIATVLNKLPRIVRDLAQEQNKRVDLTISDKDVGVDKAINELILDPLIHVLRNAVDHGIELPNDRLAAGKTDFGTIDISVTVSGSRVRLTVSDDGRGIDPEALADKVIAAGHRTKAEMAGRTPAEILDLVFIPGLSTASAITKTSGRGVGMDVVRSAAEQVGGTAELRSTPGQGTTVILDLPLTLAIVNVIVVRVAGISYALPQIDVETMVRLEPAEQAEALLNVEDALFLRREDELTPLVPASVIAPKAPPLAGGAVLELVLLRSGGRRFGFIVDQVEDNFEAVVKPLPNVIRGISPYGGATVLPDGRAALILDIGALGRGIDVSAVEAANRGRTTPVAPDLGAPVLLVAGLDDRRNAVLLDEVERLVQVPTSAIERAGEQLVFQYDDRIVRLVDHAGVLTQSSAGALGTPEMANVVICRRGDELVGLAVARIIEIRSGPASWSAVTDSRVSGTSVIDGRVTDLVDLGAYGAAGGPT